MFVLQAENNHSSNEITDVKDRTLKAFDKCNWGTVISISSPNVTVARSSEVNRELTYYFLNLQIILTQKESNQIWDLLRKLGR